jgi:hypothetical protein
MNPIGSVRAPIILGMAEVWDDDDLADALAKELSRFVPTPMVPAVERQAEDAAAEANQPSEPLWPPLREQLSGLPAPTGRPVIVPGARDGFRSTFVPAKAAPAAAVSTPSIVYDLVEPASPPRVGGAQDPFRFPPPVAGEERQFDPPTG